MVSMFRGEYGFLSNFYECEIVYGSLKFRCVESAYQALKSKDFEVRKMFESLNGSESKSLGRKIKLREDWNEIKVDVMRYLLRIKFKNKELRDKLLKSGNEELVEGNWWNDKFWGVSLKDGKGKNMLGKLLMEIREEIRKAG